MGKLTPGGHSASQYSDCEVLEERETEEGSFFRVRATQELLTHPRQQFGVP